MDEIPPRYYPDLSMLQSIISALSTKLDTYEILISGCEVLAQFFEAPLTTAWLFNDSQTELRLTAHFSVVPPGEMENVPEGCLGLLGCLGTAEGTLRTREQALLKAVLDENQIIMIPHVQMEDRLKVHRASLEAQDIRGALLVPILLESEVAGIFELSYHRPRHFHRQELVLAGSLAESVSKAIETEKSYQSLQSYAEFLDNALAQRTLELKSERDRTRSILEALGEAVIVTDMERTIQYVNPAAMELTGYAREELIGQRLRLWRSSRQTAELYTQVLSTTQAGETWRGEVINERQDGSLYNAAMTVAPLFDPQDPERVIGFVSVQRDITPIKEAEHLKDQFVSNVSHELRTPISVITLLVGNLETLYDRLNDEKRRKLIGDIRTHTQVLQDLISSVLEISRMDSGKGLLDHHPLNLAGLVREEAEKQQPLALSKNLSLQTNGIQDLWVQGNEGQLRQVIRNLLNNAIKYSQDGGEIQLACRSITGGEPETRSWPDQEKLAGGTWAAVRVRDTGIGIHAEDLPHLFERFFRVQAEGPIPGAGLGLSIARELIELHAGAIGVRSEPGVGSEFVIYLPALEEVDHDA